VIQRILEHHSYQHHHYHDRSPQQQRFDSQHGTGQGLGQGGPPAYLVKELLHYGISLVQGMIESAGEREREKRVLYFVLFDVFIFVFVFFF
jgi:hypothetical protein